MLALELLAAAMVGAVGGALVTALCVAAGRGSDADEAEAERYRRAGL